MAGHSVADLEAVRDKYFYIDRDILLDEKPKERTLFNHLLDEFEECSALKRRVEKARSGFGRQPPLPSNLFDQDVKLKPSVRATGKDAANQRKPLSRRRFREVQEGEGRAGYKWCAQEEEHFCQASPPAKSQGAARKGNATPSNFIPRSKAANMTAAEKTKVLCVLYADDSCRAKTCKSAR